MAIFRFNSTPVRWTRERKKKLIKKKLENIVPEIKQEGESERERSRKRSHSVILNRVERMVGQRSKNNS